MTKIFDPGEPTRLVILSSRIALYELMRSVAAKPVKKINKKKAIK